MSAAPFFLLVLLIIPHFQLQLSSALELDKDCKKQCNSHRPEGNKAGSFRFHCDDNDEKCRKMCGSCPEKVCSSKDDTRAYSCPPLEFPNGKCKDRCEANRPIGHREFFEFDCKYDSSPNKTGCLTCDGCPSHVCDKSKKDGKYSCPAVSFKGVCQKRCDNNRELGKVFGFILECSQEKDTDKCASDCNNFCPDFVCSRTPTTKPIDVKYNCPVPQLVGFNECQEICEKHRGNEEEEYILTCNDHYDGSTCNSFCKNCPSYVCDPKAGDNLIYCPARDDTYFPKIGELRSTKDEHLKADVNWYKTSTFILAILLGLLLIAAIVFVVVTCWKYKTRSAAQTPTSQDAELPERQERGQQMSASAPALLANIGASGDKKN